MKKAIIISGSIISGAEIVLKDYLQKTNNKFLIITSESIYNTRYFDLENTKVIFINGMQSLNSSNARGIKKFYLKFIKLFNILKVNRKIQKIIKNNKINRVILNNSADLLYVIFIKKILIYSYIHDMLSKDQFISKILKYNNNKIFRYITVSEACKKNLISIGVNQNKIEVIYNGINIHQSIKKNLSFTFVFVGTLDKRKNPAEFLKFLCELQKRNIRFSAKIIYKYFNVKILNECQNIIKMYELNVEFLYSLSRVEVMKIMQKSLFLFLSSKEDPLPTVILEAMNNSMIVIAKNIGGVPEMIENKNSGWLYNTKDEWNNIINELLKMDDEQIKKIISFNKKTLELKFNNMTKVKKLDVLFKDM